MGLITKPGDFRAMLAWCDAYTMFLDAIAEARNSRAMQAGLKDSLKHAKAEAKRTGDEQDIMAAANQEAINRHLVGSSPEQHRELLSIWKQVRTELMGTGWDLSEEIHICRDPSSPAKCCLWQGESPTPPKDALRIPNALGGVARRFLLFVAEYSAKFDPLAYTRQVLERQGITKDNFHLHADKLAITNPWASAI